MKKTILLVALLVLPLEGSFAGEGYSPSPDTAFSKAPCTVAGSNNARSGLYAPNAESDELIELEMAGCRVMAGLEKPSQSNLHEHAMVHVDGGPTLHGAAAGAKYFGAFNQEDTDFLTFEPRIRDVLRH